MMIKEIDPRSIPDGRCWVVVQTRNGETVSRTRFITEVEAREFAMTLVGKDGCLVHLEGGLLS
jgi:hypothetical protein